MPQAKDQMKKHSTKMRMPRCGSAAFARKWRHASLPAHCRSVGEPLSSAGHWWPCRGSVGHVWRRRRVPDHALAVFHRHPPGGRRGNQCQSDRRLIVFRPACASSAQNGGYPDGADPAFGRVDRVWRGGLCLQLAQGAWAGRSAGQALLCHLPWRCRRAYAG